MVLQKELYTKSRTMLIAATLFVVIVLALIIIAVMEE